jgi:hypothetical protein
MINIATGMTQRVYGGANTFCNFIGEALEMGALGTSRYKCDWSNGVVMVGETTATDSQKTMH